MDDKHDDKHLAWFLGPKAENSQLFTDTLTAIIQDYIHWRRNYYPSDKLLITRRKQRNHEEEHDKLLQNVIEMMALLRRNFPFYSPRYIGHMLSDVSMPAMLGYFAGMLYNANNVTPEAAPVTVEWEIEACNEVLKMLGYKPSPSPPGEKGKEDDWKEYEKQLKNQFGWAHITSGGTVANIEAIWVARIIKYFPLAIWKIATDEKLEINIHRPDEANKAKGENRELEAIDIRKLSEKEVVNIKPNETIFLYEKFINAVKQAKGIEKVEEASKVAAELLKKCDYSPGSNLGKIFKEGFSPVIFTSGAAHYSVEKAADILGIGRNNVIIVNTDFRFRMDVKDLEIKINQELEKGNIPLAVIAVGSTTEEGAVDPVDEIIKLRMKFENEKNISFWIHVDAAWGGYISSLFRFEEDEEANIIFDKIFRKTGIKAGKTVEQKMNSIIEALQKSELNVRPEGFNEMIDELSFQASLKNHKLFINELKKLVRKFGSNISFKNKSDSIGEILDDDAFELNDADISRETLKFVKNEVRDEVTIGKTTDTVNWGEETLINSFLQFKYADSITVDPHKMGYIQYPCGVIAFKNDRVRHFIKQDAPYITSSEPNALIHNPPRHIRNVDFEKLRVQNLPYDKYDLGTDAFGQFILEGSKPGAAAASLWLATKTIPLNRRNHGLIIKSSLLAAREIYKWLECWEGVAKEIGKDLLYKFMTFEVPDTNVVIFTVKDKNKNTINGMNKLTEEVYDNFTIHAEFGEKKHSYEQPFFISKTTMESKHYPYDSLKNFFGRCELRNCQQDYDKEGLIILRAAIMNPYITSIRKSTDQNLCREFIMELHAAAQERAKYLITKRESK